METIDTRTQLSYDDALEIFLGTDRSYGGGLSNHGPMAIEALVHMGVEHWIGPFVDHYRQRLDPARTDVEPAPNDWRAWLAHNLVKLVPHAGNLAGHGLLRVAHATRALERADATASVSPLHRRELALAIGYWQIGGPGVDGPSRLTGALTPTEWLATLGRLRPDQRAEGALTHTFRTAAATPNFGEKVASLAPAEDPTTTLDALGAAAAEAFSRNQGTSAFALVHGTTVSFMASVLLPYLDTDGARSLESAIAGFVAAAIIGFDDPQSTANRPDKVPTVIELSEAAGASKEDHTIKFTDACIGIAGRSGNPAPLAAAHRQIVNPYGLE